ncbi:MAG: hypothetical protein ACTHJS_17420 [Xanthobacteraceae bacterium]|jgi:hypothetical protein
MLRKSCCTALIVLLMVAAASAQNNTLGVPGYTNAARSNQEKKNDRDLDRAYQSTVSGRPDAAKKSDPWGDVRPAPPAPPPKNKQ